MITQGQHFKTLQDFKNALRDWAIERNWTPHILDSDSHRVRAGCRSSPNCPFRIRANYSTKRGDAKVTTCDDNHTCEPFRVNAQMRAHQDIKRAETGKLKFLLDAVPRLMTVTLETSIVDIIDTVERQYGQKIPTRQAQKVKASLVDRVKGPCRHCHQLGHTRRHCPQLTTSTPSHVSTPARGQEISNLTNEAGDGDDATYADGGLELDHGNDVPFGPLSSTSERHLNGVAISDPHTQASQNSSPVPAMSLQPDEVIMDPLLHNSIQASSIREEVVPEQDPNEQFDQTATAPIAAQDEPSPQEARLKAAQLMQQAAGLMQEAAKLNAEAARLTASVANS